MSVYVCHELSSAEVVGRSISVQNVDLCVCSVFHITQCGNELLLLLHMSHMITKMTGSAWT